MQILLSPKHNFSVMGALINCEHTEKKNFVAGCGIQESVERYMTCVMVSVHVGVQQCICNRAGGVS